MSESHSTPADAAPAPPTKLLSYLRLFRLPNVFTAVADVAMGLIFTGIPLTNWIACLGLLAASACLYTAGMVLNDVNDYEQDARERPFRPLPSGAIPRGWAALVGRGLLASGVLCAMGVGLSRGLGTFDMLRPPLIAVLLAACILAYDGGMKRTPLGPLLMGGCRFFNVLLGMSLGFAGELAGPIARLGYSIDQLLVAAGIGVYILGVTQFARTEATASRRGPLLLGLGIMIAGLMLLAIFPRFGDFGPPVAQREVLTKDGNMGIMWPGLVVLLGFVIVRRAIVAVSDPSPARVQATIKLCIMSLVMLDAAVTLVVAGPVAAVCVLALLAPMLLLGRWVYST